MKQLFTPFATFLFLALASCTDSSGYEIAKAPIVPAPPRRFDRVWSPPVKGTLTEGTLSAGA